MMTNNQWIRFYLKEGKSVKHSLNNRIVKNNRRHILDLDQCKRFKGEVT